MSFDPHLPNPGGGGDNPPNYPGSPVQPPGFGAQPGSAWNATGEPPRLDQPPRAGKRAPKKYWYAIAAALIVAGAVAIGVGVNQFTHIIAGRPTSEHTFSTGGSTTVHIDAGASKVVFIANAEEAGPHDVRCNVTNAAGQQTEIEKYPTKLTLNNWEAYFTVPANESGDYTVTCVGADSDSFGVGESAPATTWVAGFVGVFVGGGLIVIGLLTLAIALFLRRRRRVT